MRASPAEAKEGKKIKTEKSGEHENGLCDKKMEKGQLFSRFFSPFQHATTARAKSSAGGGCENFHFVHHFVLQCCCFFFVSPCFASPRRSFFPLELNFISFLDCLRYFFKGIFEGDSRNYFFRASTESESEFSVLLSVIIVNFTPFTEAEEIF